MSDWKIAADGSHTRHCTNPGCSYSESISHSLTHVAAKAATTKSEGNIEYWHCSICDKYFSDANAANEITAAQTITARLQDDDDNKPSGDKPGQDKPSTDKPSTDKPGQDKPSTDKPSTDKPSTDKPSTDKPSTDKPSTDVPPATGCHTDIALLVVMLMVSALAVTAAGTVCRKKRV